MILTSEVVRIMGVWVRRADAGLAVRAARNAAESIAAADTRRLEEIRTLRDLQQVLPAEAPVARAGSGSVPRSGYADRSGSGSDSAARSGSGSAPRSGSAVG